MRIFVHCHTSSGDVSSRLGRPDYSYYFILEKYLPVLNRIGDVVIVNDPYEEVDSLYDEARAEDRVSAGLGVRAHSR